MTINDLLIKTDETTNSIDIKIGKKDKDLITPPYKSWSEAIRAAIRLWSIIRTILTFDIKPGISIYDIKDYVLISLLGTDCVFNDCPLCEYSEYECRHEYEYSGLTDNRCTCDKCPLNTNTPGCFIYEDICTAIEEGDMHKAISKTTMLIQHLEKHANLKGETRNRR